MTLVALPLPLVLVFVFVFALAAAVGELMSPRLSPRPRDEADESSAEA